MIQDAVLPGDLRPPTEVVARGGVTYTAARWDPALLELVATRLAGAGARALASLTPVDWLPAWAETVDAFRDPGSPERLALDPVLARCTGLPGPSLQAGLEAVLGGVRGEVAGRLVAEAGPADGGRGLLLVVLAGNVPALAVQPLLPALARRRPVLLKSASSEPFFAPAFLRALTTRAPALEPALAAATWPGGDEALEAPLLQRAETVLVYGSGPTVESVRERSDIVLDYGPKLSLAVVAAGQESDAVGAGLARDVALFEQRGCLSVQAVFTDGDAVALADALGRGLEGIAGELPPGRVTPLEAVEVHQLRVDARMRGLHVAATDPAVGTVVVETSPRLRPSPGRRSVRVHPLSELARVPEILGGWKGLLQGAALAGDGAWRLEPALRDLGVTRCAPPGELQSPDARWQNGGRDLMQVL